MKNISLYVFAIALTLGITASVLTTRKMQSASELTAGAGNAAFRDGLYAGNMDAMQGNRPHLSSGRWSADVDRRSYVVGYQKGYNRVLQSGVTAVPAPQAAELTGYRDGMTDGANDRHAAKPFQPSKTENYKNARVGLVEVQSDQAHAVEVYRLAYANGYQEAYYGHERQSRDGSSDLSSSL